MYSHSEREEISARRRALLERRMALGTWQPAPVYDPDRQPPPPPPPVPSGGGRRRGGRSQWGRVIARAYRQAGLALIESEGLSLGKAAERLAKNPPPGQPAVPRRTIEWWLGKDDDEYHGA